MCCISECLLQFDDMTSTDFWNFFDAIPPEIVSDEVFSPQFSAKLVPTPLPRPSTPPDTPDKSVPQPPTSVPSPTRSFLANLNPLSGCFVHFFNYLFSESSPSSPKCPSIPGSPKKMHICPKINVIFGSRKKEARTKEPKKKKGPRCKKQVISHQMLCYQVRHIEKSKFITFF